MIFSCSYCGKDVERKRSYTVIRCTDCRVKAIKEYSKSYDKQAYYRRTD